MPPAAGPPSPAIPAEALRFSLHGDGLAWYPPGTSFGPRTLRDCEFVWIEDGQAIWHVDGRDLPAPAGTILLARPGMRDGFTWDPSRPLRHGYIHFAIVAGQASLPPAAAWPLLRHLPAGDIVLPLLRHLSWLRTSRPAGWEELAQSALGHALRAFLADAMAGAAPLPPPLHPLVERVIAGVERIWSRGRPMALSLGHLAQVAGVSRAHLARVFRTQVGATPVATLRELRLHRAATLLARTDLPVQAVADATGFVNAFHFTKAFHARFGSSPRGFRADLAAGGSAPAIRIVQIADLARRVWR